MILCCVCNIYHRVPQIFQSKNHLRILGVRMVMWRKFDPQFRSDLWTWLVQTLVARRTWTDTHFCVAKEKTAVIMLKLLGATAQRLVSWVHVAPGIYSPPFWSTAPSQPTNHKSTRFLTVSLRDRKWLHVWRCASISKHQVQYFYSRLLYWCKRQNM